jgi:SAM-dependent methyltransferase
MRKERLPFRPSKEALRAIEDCRHDITPDSHELREWHNSYTANQTIRIASDLDIVKQHAPPNSDILEVGSIPLLLTCALKKSNYNVVGCDIAPERYSSALDDLGINVLKCNVDTDTLPFEDQSFDAIVFNEIFEHLRIDLIFSLSEILRVLKPGGCLMLSTPNLRSLKGISNYLIRNKAYSCSGDIYTEYQKLRKLGHMGHVREYTTREVVELLQNIGFSVTKIIYRGQYRGYLARLIITSIPSLSPFVSYIATKPNHNINSGMKSG